MGNGKFHIPGVVCYLSKRLCCFCLLDLGFVCPFSPSRKKGRAGFSLGRLGPSGVLDRAGKAPDAAEMPTV